tara:strand:+ start:1346 stop:1543 length:198 start_codon:yes stop_codon:yes gene_type:complete
MNDLVVFIYGIGFACVTGAAFAFMWKSMSIVQDELKKPVRKRHPEMEDVKNGDELLVFRAEEKRE